MTIETVFKIRNKTTDLFSTGGYTLRWNEVGKQWKTKGALHNDLNLIEDATYHNCEIVLFELREVASEFTSMDLGAYCEDRQKQRELKREAYKLAVEEEHRQREIRKALQTLEDNGIEVKV